MQILKSKQGVLQIDVSSEGNYINAGSNVTAQVVADNKNLYVRIISISKSVKLNYLDTNIDFIVL